MYNIKKIEYKADVDKRNKAQNEKEKKKYESENDPSEEEDSEAGNRLPQVKRGKMKEAKDPRYEKKKVSKKWEK